MSFQPHHYHFFSLEDGPVSSSPQSSLQPTGTFDSYYFPGMPGLCTMNFGTWSFLYFWSLGITKKALPQENTLQWSAFLQYQKFGLTMRGIIYVTQEKTQERRSGAGSATLTIGGTGSFYLPAFSFSVCSLFLHGSCENTFLEGRKG